jgi:hypothetical protein
MPLPARHLTRLIASIAVTVALAVVIVGGLGAGAVHADEAVRPVAECVIVNGDGTFTAFFGYRNSSGRSVTLDSRRNRVRGGSSSGTPSVFSAGRVVAAFSVTSNGTSISWTLDGSVINVDPTFTPCSTNPSVPEAPVALLLMLAPAAMTSWWLHRRRPRPRPRPC